MLLHKVNSATENFDSLAKRAAEAKDADRLDEAVALYKKALALRPKWTEGWWSLGTIEYDRNNYQSAAAAFRQVLPLAPKDGTVHAMLGLCEFELGEDDAALKHLAEATRMNVSSNPQLRSVLLYHYGILLLRARKFQNAQTVLGGLCLNSIPGQEALRSLGWSAFRLLPTAAPAVGSQGDVIMEHTGHAACLAVQKKMDEAGREYAQLVNAYPDYPNIHYVYGRFLVDANEVPKAIEEFQKEIQRNPKDINSRLEIAAANYKLNSAAGIPFAEEAVRIDPQVPFAHYLLGLLYLDTDEFNKAIPQLELAEKAFPEDPKVCFALGSAYAESRT